MLRAVLLLRICGTLAAGCGCASHGYTQKIQSIETDNWTNYLWNKMVDRGKCWSKFVEILQNKNAFSTHILIPRCITSVHHFVDSWNFSMCTALPRVARQKTLARPTARVCICSSMLFVYDARSRSITLAGWRVCVWRCPMPMHYCHRHVANIRITRSTSMYAGRLSLFCYFGANHTQW